MEVFEKGIRVLSAPGDQAQTGELASPPILALTLGLIIAQGVALTLD